MSSKIVINNNDGATAEKATQSNERKRGRAVIKYKI